MSNLYLTYYFSFVSQKATADHLSKAKPHNATSSKLILATVLLK